MAKEYVYILMSEKVSKTYTGVSSDPIKRLKEHDSGSNVFTRKYKPWRLFYTEKFSSRKDALDREKYLKSHAGRKFIKKLIENRLNN